MDQPLSYTAAARQYAKDVVAGKVPTSKWVRLACQRQIKDLIRFKGKESPYRFNLKLTAKNGRPFYPAERQVQRFEVRAHCIGIGMGFVRGCFHRRLLGCGRR